MAENIYKRLSKITDELGVVAKNLEVQTGVSKSYKAVSERDVIDAVKPLEVKHGVYSYPVSREVIESNLLESETTYNNKTTKKTTFMTRIKTVYRFVNVDDPAEFVETTVFSEGIDAQDKGSGKAMTYADKYALMKAYKLSTGDDPDASASIDTDYRVKAKLEVPEIPKEPAKNAVICPKCKKPILRDHLKGEWREPEEILDALGMCVTCYRGNK